MCIIKVSGWSDFNDYTMWFQFIDKAQFSKLLQEVYHKKG